MGIQIKITAEEKREGIFFEEQIRVYRRMMVECGERGYDSVRRG